MFGLTPLGQPAFNAPLPEACAISAYSRPLIEFVGELTRNAEQLAKILVKKRRITVTAPVAGMRITSLNAASLALHLEH